MTTSKPSTDAGGRALARNTAYNLLGQALPLVVGLMAIPIAARHLGPERFGVLGLVWALVSYFGLLDLGLGRATTKHVAALLARGDVTSLRSVTTISVVAQSGLGVCGGAALALVTPWLVRRGLNVPLPLQPEVLGAFLVVAASIPVVAVSSALRAILEAAQRFDVMNLVRTPAVAAMFAVPAVVASAGGGLVEIAAWLLGIRLVAAGVWERAARHAVPGLRWELRPSWALFKPLAAYGAWTAVANVVSPVLGYLERFLLASLVGLEAVGYYTGPAEAVTRLLIIPVALAGALFPAVSAEAGPRGAWLAATSLRYLWLTLTPLTLLLALFANPIVEVWLGADYAARGAGAFGVLAVGVLVNGLAHVPSAFLYGRGRPDLPAKFAAIELPLYVVAAWLLIRAYGVTGAAVAWTLRVTVDAILLFAAMRVVSARRTP